MDKQTKFLNRVRLLKLATHVIWFVFNAFLLTIFLNHNLVCILIMVLYISGFLAIDDFYEKKEKD